MKELLEANGCTFTEPKTLAMDAKSPRQQAEEDLPESMSFYADILAAEQEEIELTGVSNPGMRVDLERSLVVIEELQSIEDCFTKNDMDTSLNNKFKEYWTPVHIMFQGGHAEIIRSLRQKIDFEFINPKWFENSLYGAIKRGHFDCIKALLEKQTSEFNVLNNEQLINQKQ